MASLFRYVSALEVRQMLPEARHAFARASGHFLKARCSFVLEHAAFEEAHGFYDEARNLYAAATALQPPVLGAALAQASLERRLGDVARMHAAFEAGATAFSGEELTYLIRHAVRLERQLRGSYAWAVELLETALRREPSSELLWDLRIDFELDCIEVEPATPMGTAPTTAGTAPMTAGAAPAAGSAPAAGAAPAAVRHRASGAAMARLTALYERAISSVSPLSDEAQQAMWRRYEQCLLDYSESIERVRQLRTRSRKEAPSSKRQKTLPAPPDTPGAAPTQPLASPLASAGAPPSYHYPPPYASTSSEYAHPAAAAVVGGYPPYYAYPPYFQQQQAFTFNGSFPYCG
jgi:tetratricopeptide (TPR) repeat protein